MFVCIYAHVYVCIAGVDHLDWDVSFDVGVCVCVCVCVRVFM